MPTLQKGKRIGGLHVSGVDMAIRLCTLHPRSQRPAITSLPRVHPGRRVRGRSIRRFLLVKKKRFRAVFVPDVGDATISNRFATMMACKAHAVAELKLLFRNKPEVTEFEVVLLKDRSSIHSWKTKRPVTATILPFERGVNAG